METVAPDVAGDGGGGRCSSVGLGRGRRRRCRLWLGTDATVDAVALDLLGTKAVVDAATPDLVRDGGGRAGCGWAPRRWWTRRHRMWPVVDTAVLDVDTDEGGSDGLCGSRERRKSRRGERDVWERDSAWGPQLASGYNLAQRAIWPFCVGYALREK
ncbi:hypothetical protein [Oryza sativa Japonica Group]|uniref:Uncharacterized protein P0028G04.3 n=1 Tax=Oryza sativa subsp. japonica TaxID=39947 RepID=Q655E1_ORYSJ|nr:hypothetical protein [Oryza sativa Japonica Group]